MLMAVTVLALLLGWALKSAVEARAVPFEAAGIAAEVPAGWLRVTNAGSILDKLPLLIDESSALTVDAICARVRQCNATTRLGLVVIDYLTQITPPRAESMTEAIQAITRQL